MEIDISGAVQGFVQDVEKQVASRAERAAHVIRKYRKPASNKTYTASAPGEPPALRTGDLRRSFRPLAKSEIVQSAKHYTPGIRTDVKYAPFLEDGTSRISPRPYAEEIKQKAFPEVKAIFEEETTSAAIDTTAIHPGDLIRAKYADWNEAKNGIVTAVTGGEIRCLYFPGIRNVCNYFLIAADEVTEGLWDISWSADMKTIQTEGAQHDA